MADDQAELDALMGRFLACVSFAEGERPAYDRLAGLFTAGARVIRTGPEPSESSTLHEFVEVRARRVEAGELTSFEETEVAETTELFGNVAHRFSIYEKHGTTPQAPIGGRGAISTQFVRTPDGWRISSMAWDDERPGLELPERSGSRRTPL